jgi:hypothetical protein
MSFPGLTVGESFVFEWQYRYAGDFKRTLAEAICLADEGNRYKLSKGFPYEVQAMINYFYTEGWWKELQNKCVELGYLRKLEGGNDSEKK